VPTTLDELAYGRPLVVIKGNRAAGELLVRGPHQGGVGRDQDRRGATRTPRAQCRGWIRANVPDAAVSLVASNATAAVRRRGRRI